MLATMLRSRPTAKGLGAVGRARQLAPTTRLPAAHATREAPAAQRSQTAAAAP